MACCRILALLSSLILVFCLSNVMMICAKIKFIVKSDPMITTTEKYMYTVKG